MRIAILLYFTISKNHFITYTILFYNISNIPKLYYFTILLKYYFLSPEANIKNSFLVWLCSICAHFLSLSLSLLSHFSVTYLGLIVLRLWIMGRGSWICDMGFTVLHGCDPVGFWISLCSTSGGFLGFPVLVLIRLWYGFFWVLLCSVVLGWLWCGLVVLVKLQRWRPSVGFAVLNGVTMLSIRWVFGFRCVGCDPVVIWVFLGFAMLCGAGLVVLVKFQRWWERWETEMKEIENYYYHRWKR